jgi:hypothetical protein
MPKTRLLASRTTAKASGKIASSVSPCSIRSLNSAVFAFNSSSLNASSVGSSAFIFFDFLTHLLE